MLIIICIYQSAEAELEENKAKKGVSYPGDGVGEKMASGVEQHWTNTVAQLKVG